MQTSMSIRLPKELATQLGELAEATGRTKSFLAVQALHEFVERESWQVAEIQKALREAEEGDFAPDEDVAALDQKWSYHAH
ncbi:CopG family ribbon-helix-helix protein [uncultured Desulfovibrio sp.]|uniref:CopG family ribbon-helix-helix protein n=1 Tax=uncultured Desulfovibrio sp. TaxID=167968 RepID=UPI00261A10A4|nr:CopG family ribbon-helix-helix protein [uncultured Desulfovibrio sp.]